MLQLYNKYIFFLRQTANTFSKPENFQWPFNVLVQMIAKETAVTVPRDRTWKHQHVLPWILQDA